MFYHFEAKDLQILEKTAERMKNKKISPYEVTILESFVSGMSIIVYCPTQYSEHFLNYMKTTYNIKPNSYSYLR